MADSLKEYINKLSKNCNSIHSIQDINNMYNYEDKIGGGNSLEWDLLSCGQDGSKSGYNELERYYYTHIPDNLKAKYKYDILKNLCECCKELDHSVRTHNKFKECVDKKLAKIKLLFKLGNR